MADRTPTFAYRLLWWLLLPAAVLKALWRSRREPLYREDFGQRFGVDPVRIIPADREVDDSWAFPAWIPGYEIPQRTQGLGTQVAALDDVMIHDRTDPAGLASSVIPVEVVHQGGGDLVSG